MPSEPGLARYLKPADLVDNFTRSLYKVAPYQGCAHGCRYCDGRAERYYVEGDFERDIVVRDSIPARLAADLPRLRESGMIAFGSGTTDPYQPCEETERITGRCAEALATWTGTVSANMTGSLASPGSLFEEDPASGPRLPVLVMTKSSRALEDLPRWKAVNEAAGFVLLVSITSLDEELRATMEPGASPFSERVKLLRAYKEAGCVVGILAMPFLPGLSDHEASIRSLFEAAASIGVDYLMPGGLTLRPGRQKDFYLDKLSAYRPDLVDATRALYSDERPSGWPGKVATEGLNTVIRKLRQDIPIPWLLPHRVFARLLPPHDALRVLFRDMVELYADKGIDTTALKRSADRYDTWLIEQRRDFRRHRGLPASWLDGRLPEALVSGELGPVLDNPRLLSFSKTVTLDGARFDYLTLKLE